MLNLSEVVALLENLASGKGVFLAGATGPYFVKSDGSILDKDGVQVAKASLLGKKYYDDYAGNFPLTGVVPAAQLPAPTDTTKGGVLAAAKGAGDTVVAKLGTDGKLYVPTYPTDAQYDMTPYMVDVDEFVTSNPVIYADDDLWVAEGASKIYKADTNAWVEITANKIIMTTAAPTVYIPGDFWVKQNAGADELFVQTANAWVAHVGTFTEAAAAPEAPAPVDGDYYYNTTSSKLFLYVTNTWVEVTTQQVVRAASAPVIYVNGDYFYDTDTGDKLYMLVALSWVEQTTMQHIYVVTAPLFYSDGYKIASYTTGKVYTKAAGSWGSGVDMAAGKIYAAATLAVAVIPAATTAVKGSVLKAASRADSAATDVAGVNTVLNDLLAKLRAAGIIAT